jgi:hypothetical protein
VGLVGIVCCFFLKKSVSFFSLAEANGDNTPAGAQGRVPRDGLGFTAFEKSLREDLTVSRFIKYYS